MIPDLPAARLEEAYSRVLVMRKFDEQVVRLFEARAFSGHYHVYFGQEATGAAIGMVAEARDYLFTTHRNHGHLIGRGVDPGRVMAEILGRVTGTNQGVAGSFHCSDPALGFIHSTAVVAGIVPLAVGAAYGARRSGGQQVSMAIFGEGALQEGAFHEAIELAALYRPPVIFLVENNDAESVAGERVGSYTYLKTAPVKDFGDYARIHDIPAESVDGADLGAVYGVLSEAFRRARLGDGPTFIEARTFRWPGQFGSWPTLVQGPVRVVYSWDESMVPAAYRQWWLDRDPVIRLTRELLAAGTLNRQRALALEADATSTVAEAVRFAQESAFPLAETALDHVYV